MRVDFGACTLRSAGGSQFEARVRGRVMGHRKSLGNAVVVGDDVGYEHKARAAMVVDVAARRNAFSRRASGVRPQEQVVAANLDQVVLVASIREPEFSPGFADRVFAQAAHSGIPAGLVINKVDLGPLDETRAILADYGRAGYAGVAVSARTHEGIEHLRQECRDRRTLFVGHSGVGKSTLLNTLCPGLGLRSSEVNRKTGKGRHTTTAAWMQVPAPGLELIDTPGMRGFGLWDVGESGLERCYPEFLPILGQCRFRDCRHDREPGCALRAAVAAGVISERRFESFHKLRDELAEEAMLERPRTGDWR